MPKSANEVWRDFVRFTGDGLPNEPVGHGLPTGDPSSGEHSPKKWEIRDWAGGMQISLDRAEDAADLAMQAALDAQGASLFAADVPSLLANTAASYPAGTIFATRAEGYSYEVAPAGATNHDAVTAGGVKLYRLRPKRLIFAYSQSNFAGISAGTPWIEPPPGNLFVWNGGNWNGDIVPPIGTAFVPAAQREPQVPVAYAAELARSQPGIDWHLVIVARGGTGIRALTGVRYRWRTATTGAPASGDIRFDAANAQVAYNETDLLGDMRFLGTSDLGVNTFYPARIETTADGGARWIEFRPKAAATDAGDYRTQPITVLSSQNWPPPDGTGITVFPTEPRMREVIDTNLTAAMDAMKLTGDRRKIDKLLIWPTESDLNYPAAYKADYDWLMTFLGNRGKSPATSVVMTLPYPYGDGIAEVRHVWWNTIRAIAQQDPDHRTVVSLAASGPENWGDANNIHVIGSGREIVGRLMRRAEETGGSDAPMQAGFYTPTITNVANVAGITVHEAQWIRIGPVVRVSGAVTLSPAATATATQARISLPVPSNILTSVSLTGMAVTTVADDHAGTITGDTANNAALLSFKSRSALGGRWEYEFSYRIRES